MPEKKPSDWDLALPIVKSGLADIACNRFRAAQALFTKALDEGTKASISDTGVLAMYKVGIAAVNLSEGFSSGALDRLGDSLDTLWEAEDLAYSSSRQWVGNSLIRGVCLMFGGMIQVIQQSWVKAGINITKAWTIIRPSLVEALDYRGSEREFVRNLALFLNGTLNLLVSVLPSKLLSLIELVGFEGSRSKSLSSLESCRTEDGPFSPFAALIILNFLLVVRPYLLETVKTGDKVEAQTVIEWAKAKYPGSFFFHLAEASLFMVSREPGLAVKALSGLAESAGEVPTLQMLLFYRRGFANLANGNHRAALLDFNSARDAQLNSGRQSYVPFLSMLSLGCKKTLDPAADVSVDFSIIEKMRLEIEKSDTWLPSDRWSFRRSAEYKTIEKPNYSLDLYYAGVLCFSSTMDKTPLTVRSEIITPLLDKLPSDAPVGELAKRQLIRAEVLRLAGKRGEALDALDSILDRSDVEFKGYERDALRQLSLVWQALLFAQAAEPEAASEALKDLDDWQLKNSGVFGHLSSGMDSDFDVVLKFKRQGVQRMIDASGFQSAESSDN